MFWIAGGLVFIVLCWLFAIKRGQKAVRAYVFITYRRGNYSIEEANKFAMNLSAREAAGLQDGTLALARNDFSGQQLRMIAAARAEGFAG